MKTIDRRKFITLAAAPMLMTGCEPGAVPITGRHRARELGITIGRMQPGTLNAITDVAGVEVGHATIIEGSGRLVRGEGPVRTGVTAIWPQRNVIEEFLCCGVDAPNGNGELSGMLAAERLGFLSSPICLTNTSSVGMVYDVLQKLQPVDELPAGTPVVGETWDGSLNDIIGRHVLDHHVHDALQSAKGGPVTEGAVGGGTGMICYEFKGGIGTASRIVEVAGIRYRLGVLVQSNHGTRELLRIDGVPVGQALSGYTGATGKPEQNSIIMVIATDAPFLPHQLKRIARRATHGLAKTGSISSNSSGDFTLAFSTANAIPRELFYNGPTYTLASIDQFSIQPFLEATSEAVEEAIINSMFMAEDMAGIDDYFVPAIPLRETVDIMRKYGRLGGSGNG